MKALIEQGGVIVIPTDTVYGLAADFRNESACKLLFQLKGRSENMPLVILAATREELKGLITAPLPLFTETLWPGPLTLVLPAALDKVPAWVRANRPTVGVRIPDHPDALALLRQTGPLAVTSANPSGLPPATTLEGVTFYFPDIPVLPTAIPPKGSASTIASIDPLTILRQGGITKEQLQ